MNGTLLLLSGPNLDQLGTRQPEIYGTATLADHVATATRAAEARGWAVEHVQSSHEGDLVRAIHDAKPRCAALVINPGAFSHYAYAITDALASFPGVVVELHLSNPMAREEWRRRSVIAQVANATVAGFGARGYRIAVDAAIDLAEEAP